MKFSLLLGLFLVVGGCSRDKSESALSVTVEELCAHPEKYDGQLISTQGVWVGFFESSTLRPTETKITAKSDNPNDIWLTFDEDSLIKSSQSESEKLLKSQKKWESTAEILFFKIEFEGVFKHKTAGNGSNGYGHMGMYSSELRVTRLLSSKYLDGITIEPLPFTPPPSVQQQYIITNVSQTQTITLKRMREAEKISDLDGLAPMSDLEITMEGELQGNAEFQMLLDGKPLQQARVSGKFRTKFRDDWFWDEVDIRFLPSENTSGNVTINYMFIPHRSLPFKEVRTSEKKR